MIGLLSTVVPVLCQATPQAFTDLGAGAPVAESRGVVTTRTSEGRCLVIANALDQGPRGYVLVTDIDSGLTTQHVCPEGVPQSAAFGSLMAADGTFYTAQGKVLLGFDPAARKWTYQGIPAPNASCYLSFTEDDRPDGLIWAGGYNTELVSLNPHTKEARGHGRLDDDEHYLMSLAVDDRGWVYGGIGTARCNIVGYDPQTGERRQLLPEAKRTHGTATVHPGVDGNVYGKAGRESYRLSAGQATPVSEADVAPRKRVRTVYYGQHHEDFPDGRRLIRHSMPDRWMDVQEAADGAVRRIAFDYESEGAAITSLGVGPDGFVYASTCHPMHLLRIDAATQGLSDLGAIPAIGGGNFCAITTNGRLVLGTEYAGGRLWTFDVDRPWTPTAAKRISLGITAKQLAADGEAVNGRLRYLPNHDVAFIRGDAFGAEAHFPLSVPNPGEYYLHVVPFTSPRYCDIRLAMDDEVLADRVSTQAEHTAPGELLVFGPLRLPTGEHRLSVTTLDTPGQEPWVSLVTASLTPERQQSLLRTEPANPQSVAQWKKDICRPRTILMHPDGEHVLMAGFAGYGLCGGGIGIHNLRNGRNTLMTAADDLLPGHSCITMAALPGGDIVGGTSVDAPGGGHAVATEGELFVLDWETKSVTSRTVPVAGDRNVVSIVALPHGLVYGLSSNSTFFVFDPARQQILHRERLHAFGSVPRHALLPGPDGLLYALLSRSVLRIDTKTFVCTRLADTPAAVTAGGAVVRRHLCFASTSHVWTYRIPEQ